MLSKEYPGPGAPAIDLHDVPDGPGAGDAGDIGSSRRPSAWRRLLRKRLAMISLAMILLLVVAAIFAGQLAPHSPQAIDYDRIDGYPDFAHRYSQLPPRGGEASEVRWPILLQVADFVAEVSEQSRQPLRRGSRARTRWGSFPPPQTARRRAPPRWR